MRFLVTCREENMGSQIPFTIENRQPNGYVQGAVWRAQIRAEKPGAYEAKCLSDAKSSLR
jgi:hypothetical protein